MPTIATNIQVEKFYGARIDNEIAAVYAKGVNKKLIMRNEIAGKGLAVTYFVVLMFEGDHCCYENSCNTLGEAVEMYNDLE